MCVVATAGHNTALVDVHNSSTYAATVCDIPDMVIHTSLDEYDDVQGVADGGR